MPPTPLSLNQLLCRSPCQSCSAKPRPDELHFCFSILQSPESNNLFQLATRNRNRPVITVAVLLPPPVSGFATARLGERHIKTLHQVPFHFGGTTNVYLLGPRL